jgi:POT family proton-dependent oligopeptide transporter
MTKQGLLDIYELFGFISIGVAVVVLLLSPIVKRWMHLDTLQDRDDGPIALAGSAEAGLEAQEGGMHPPASPAR